MLQAAQDIARNGDAFWTWRIDRHIQRIKVGYGFYGDDLGTPNAIDQQIACGGEQEGFGLVGQAGLGRLANPRVNLLAKIFYVALVTPVLVQVMHQDRFQRQDFSNEPILYGRRSHTRAQTGLVGIVRVGLSCLGHPPQASAYRGLHRKSVAKTNESREFTEENFAEVTAILLRQLFLAPEKKALFVSLPKPIQVQHGAISNARPTAALTPTLLSSRPPKRSTTAALVNHSKGPGSMPPIVSS